MSAQAGSAARAVAAAMLISVSSRRRRYTTLQVGLVRSAGESEASQFSSPSQSPTLQ